MAENPPPAFLCEIGEPQLPFEEWYELFVTYLVAKGGETFSDVRKRATLLNCLGVEGQRQFSALLGVPLSVPVAEESTNPLYEDAVQRLRDRFSQRRSRITLRCEFIARVQAPGESVATFVSNLRKLASKADFTGYSGDQAIMDHFIARTTNAEIRDRLLLEGDSLTLQRAMDIAMRMETAAHESKNLADATAFALRMSAEVQTSEIKLKNQKDSLHKCLRSRRLQEDFNCHGCGLVGHHFNHRNSSALRTSC